MPATPKTEELRVEQIQRERDEHARARARPSEPAEERQHERRAERAAYLREKLGERAESEERVEDDRMTEDHTRSRRTRRSASSPTWRSARERVGEHIDEARKDWEAKVADPSVPGAGGEPRRTGRPAPGDGVPGQGLGRRGDRRIRPTTTAHDTRADARAPSAVARRATRPASAVTRADPAPCPGGGRRAARRPRRRAASGTTATKPQPMLKTSHISASGTVAALARRASNTGGTGQRRLDREADARR